MLGTRRVVVVHLFEVSPPSVPPVPVDLQAALGGPDVGGSGPQNRRERRQRARLLGLHSEALVAPDLATVAETLVELVRKYDSHRRVETHGPRALREVILGNTTQELLKTAPCPVVAAGTQAD
jgi:nucleotide-binding universal stress UspA family protein